MKMTRSYLRESTLDQNYFLKISMLAGDLGSKDLQKCKICDRHRYQMNCFPENSYEIILWTTVSTQYI